MTNDERRAVLRDLLGIPAPTPSRGGWRLIVPPLVAAVLASGVA
jgi:hypothetical protein